MIDPDDQVGKSHLLNPGYESDLEKWLRLFQSDTRAQDSRFADVAALIRKAIRPSQEGRLRVAEIGAGTGIAVFNLTRTLKESLKEEEQLEVYASEPTQNFLKYMREQLRDVHTDLQDVLRIVEGTVEHPGFQKSQEEEPLLPKNSLDAVTLHNTYHHIDNRVRFMRRLREEWLAPGTGLVFIQDLSTEPEKLKEGMPGLGHRLSEGQVDQEMRLAGFSRVEDPELLQDIQTLNQNTPYVYNMLFRAPKPDELKQE